MQLFHGLLMMIVGFNSFAYYALLAELKENSLLARASYVTAYFKNGLMICGALYGLCSLYQNVDSEILSLDSSYYSSGEQFMFQLSIDTLWVLICILISAFLASFLLALFEKLHHKGLIVFLKKTKCNLEHFNSQPIYPMMGAPAKIMNTGNGRQERASSSMAAQEAIAKMEQEKNKKA